MNPTAYKKLQELLVQGFKDPNSLTPSDIEFLQARRGYVKQKHQDRLLSVFGKDALKTAIDTKVKADKQSEKKGQIDKPTNTSEHPADKK